MSERATWCHFEKSSPGTHNSRFGRRFAASRAPLTNDSSAAADLIETARPALPASRSTLHDGSVWESNPLTAFFKPPTGFEDQGPHQRCKHSQGRLGASRLATARQVLSKALR